MSNAPKIWHRVTNPKAARVLNDPMVFRSLQPFLNRENTVGVAAKMAGMTNVQMFRHVKQFLLLGLLEITRLEARAGKAIKHYRTVAPGFFIPHTLLPSETLEIEFLTQDDFWRQRLARGLGAVARDAMSSAGSYIFRNDQGDIRKVTGRSDGLNVLPENVSPNSNLTPVWSDWSVVMLEPEDAQEFYQDMAELFKRYKARHARMKGRPYLIRTAMAPLCEDDAKTIVRR
jgi:hypothetical protein